MPEAMRCGCADGELARRSRDQPAGGYCARHRLRFAMLPLADCPRSRGEQAAERWIAAAAARGAELVLLPDCFACGYCLSSAAWKFAGVSWAQHRKRAGRGSEQQRRQLVCSARRTRLWALNARFRWSAASTMPVRWRLRALCNNTTSFPPRTQGACSAYLPICLSIRLSIPLSEQLLPCMPTSLSLLAGPLVRAGKHSRT